MPLNQREMIINIPGLIKLIAKLIRFSRGGLDKSEREELSLDLIQLASQIVPDVVD
jgi:hypothetical protein